MNDNWYYASGNQQRGPVSLEALRQLLVDNQLPPATLVWTDGMPQWVPASSVPELRSGASAAAPAPAPGAFPGAQPAPIGYYAPYNPSRVVYAGFWLRFVAFIIDWLVTFVIGFIVGGCFGFVIGFAMGAQGSTGQDAEMVAGVVGYLLGILIGWLYYALQESSARQATIGKNAMGLIVTDVEGQRISFGRATGRHFAKIISLIILFVGFIMIGFTERKQGLHDMIASTLVLKKT